MTDIFLTPTRTGDGISLEWRVSGALPADIARQLPFARSLALNRTAVESVATVRRETAQNFTRRAQSQQFFDQSFIVTQYATKTRPEIEFGTSRALLQGRGASLLDHEDGTDRVATGRNKFPYIPVIGSSMRRSASDLLPRWLYPKALGLIDRRGIDGGTVAGGDRTASRRGSTRGLRAQQNAKGFILRNAQGEPLGIFRRVPLAGMRMTGRREGGKKLTRAKRRRRGTGQSTLELLFATPKVIRIEPRLGFRRIADHAMLTGIEANFAGMLAYAIDRGRQQRTAQLMELDAGLIQTFRGGRR